MAVDPTPVYGPSRSFTSSSISDASVSGRAVLTGTAAVGRAALGISDLSSWELDALAYANSVCGFTRTPEIWRGDHVEAAGTTSSPWLTATATGTGAQTLISATPDANGVRQYTTGALAASAMQLHSTQGGSFVKPLMNELLSAKWLLAMDLKVTTTPDAQAELSVGWNGIALASGKPMLGVRGGLSTTKYACHLMDSNTGTASTVTVDANWHKGYQWNDGHASRILFSFDNESALTLGGLSATDVVGPFVNVRNFLTAAAQTVRLRNCVIFYEPVA